MRRWAVVIRQGYANDPNRKGPITRREDHLTRLGARARARALRYQPRTIGMAALGPMWHTDVMPRADADLLEQRVGSAS